MMRAGIARAALVGGLALLLAGCGGGGGGVLGGLFGRDRAEIPSERKLANLEAAEAQEEAIARATGEEDDGSSIWDLFGNADDPNTTVEVNKYLWQASLEVLNFLPVESVDPFTGVLVTGYGTPPGGGRVYRATVYVQDPALDARSLKVALQGRGGAAVSVDTVRAVEDAILTRARQLRIRDSKL
jgi:hypothetical protein